MNNLFILGEIFTNGYKNDVLNIITWSIILCGIFVIISRNPIISILYLIGLFASISLYLIFIGLNFVGLSYLIVYIGAVSILFLFILMLINIRISELQSNTNNSIILGLIIVILFNYCILKIFPYNLSILNNLNISINKILSINNYYYYLNNINTNNTKILFINNNTWDANLSENSHITSIGNILYTNYNMWLIISSLILLLAMVGSIVITMNRK